MYSERIQKLIDLFSRFPTVGPRTAARFVFYLIKNPKEKTAELLKAIENLAEKIKICGFCGKPYEENNGQNDLCEICSSGARDKTLLCVVEKEEDLEAIENTKIFKGLYFILTGAISGLKSEKNKEEIEKRLAKLIERIKNKETEIKEIIIALNPTVEGENAALWLERKLKNLGLKMTRLARGLPKGGELEYADEETLSSALESRR